MVELNLRYMILDPEPSRREWSVRQLRAEALDQITLKVIVAHESFSDVMKVSVPDLHARLELMPPC